MHDVRNSLVGFLMLQALDGKTCQVCQKAFTKEEALDHKCEIHILSDPPLEYAHEACWEKYQRENKNVKT